MKKLILTLTLFCASLVFVQGQGVDAMFEMLRADLRVEKRQAIDEIMELNPDEAKAFWPLYDAYEAERTLLGDARLELIQAYAANYAVMTEKIADDLAKSSLDLEKKRLTLKNKYYKKTRKALSPITAIRWLQLEGQIEAIADVQIVANLPFMPKPSEE